MRSFHEYSASYDIATDNSVALRSQLWNGTHFTANAADYMPSMSAPHRDSSIIQIPNTATAQGCIHEGFHEGNFLSTPNVVENSLLRRHYEDSLASRIGAIVLSVGSPCHHEGIINYLGGSPASITVEVPAFPVDSPFYEHLDIHQSNISSQRHPIYNNASYDALHLDGDVTSFDTEFLPNIQDATITVDSDSRILRKSNAEADNVTDRHKIIRIPESSTTQQQASVQECTSTRKLHRKLTNVPNVTISLGAKTIETLIRSAAMVRKRERRLTIRIFVS
ncbi:hypothetical protein BU17DRAFT_61185 [Hysterangium stoloniferum]|nr:hypothetical protein BU17DRAFT_61185 [Hysterangium stoloniferum]